MRTLSLCFVALLAAACGQQTPKYHISYSGSDPETDVSSVNPEQIDLAAEHAANLAGVSPDVFAERGVIVYLHKGPIQVWGEKLYGDAQETVIQSQLLLCLFQSDSALLHEFFHEALWLSTSDYDNTHSSPKWHEVETQRGTLEIEACR